jgi:hypothetical protein
VIASAIVHGRRQIIGHGRIRDHRLSITYRHLHRGRYRVTLFEKARHGLQLIVHTTIVVT